MKAVVGLGNPGPEYAGTRHNVGFRVLAELARRQGATQPKLKFEAEVLEVMVGGEKLLLVAPQTFMNNSGRSVRKLVDFFRLPLDELLVVCDDLNLETARLRIRQAGSAGGQKGLSDMISRLGTQEFSRLRIGIGRPPGRMNAADYVLRRFRAEEQELIQPAVSLAADAVEVWCMQGVEAAMNRFNAPAQPREREKGKQQEESGHDET